MSPPGNSSAGPRPTDRPPAEPHTDTAIVPRPTDTVVQEREAELRRLDDDYVRRSYVRSWDQEVRRLRRLLREPAA